MKLYNSATGTLLTRIKYVFNPPDGKQLPELRGAKSVDEAMRLYLADTGKNHFGYAQQSGINNGYPCRILTSYFYFKSKSMDEFCEDAFEKPWPNIFIDSGAFSAWSLGKPISVKGYGEWLLKNAHVADHYANLDVKGDVEAGLENQRVLESMGLSPIPVYHAGEPWGVLEAMVEKYPYIALGGIAGENRGGLDASMRFIINCFKIADGRSVFHAFGITRWDMLASFPWYSADSTSWGSGFRFGIVPVFDPRTGTLDKIKIGERSKWLKKSRLLKSYGVDWTYLADKRKYHWSYAALVGAVSYQTAESWMTKKHGVIEIPKR